MKSKCEHSSKYEAKKPSSKYEVKLLPRQNTKAKKASSKYEVGCEAFIFQRKNETFVEIRTQSVKPSFFRGKTKPSLKYEVKV
jgi:hypothetical protein